MSLIDSITSGEMRLFFKLLLVLHFSGSGTFSMIIVMMKYERTKKSLQIMTKIVLRYYARTT